MKEKMHNKPKKRKNTWTQYLVTALWVLIGFVCGIAFVKYIRIPENNVTLYEALFYLCGLLLGMCVAIIAQLILHEAGHLIFGLLSGYRFSSFRLFNLILVNENGKLKLKRLEIAGTGGQCLMVPPDLKDGKIPFVFYNLGGALMNLIAGVIFICMYFLLRDIQLFSAVMLLCAVVGFVFAITNGVPMRTNTVDNDGYNTLALARSKDAMRAFWIQLKVSEKISKDVRLKDMPEEWFAVPSDEAMQNSMIAVLGVFACSRLMDQQQFEKANELMAHMFDADSNICGIHRNLLICDRIYIELITENRQEHLAELFSKEQKKFMRQMQNFPSVLRTQYAYALLCEHDVAKAEQIKTQFQKCARVYPYPNEILSEKELMEIAKKHA